VSETQETAPPGGKGFVIGSLRERLGFGLVTIAPATALMGVFLFGPILVAAWLSLHRWGGIGPIDDFVGLANYERLLRSGDLPQAIGVNVAFGLGMVPLTVLLGFLLAAAVHFRMRGWPVYRAAWFFPVIMPGTVVAILWSTAVLGPVIGLADVLLNEAGIPPPSTGILGTPGVSMVAVVLVATWAGVGVPFVILLAGMERIPADIYEAARLDGASEGQVLRHLTAPLARPVILTVVVLQVLYAIRVFDIFFIMTGGGPGRATTTVAFLIYDESFRAFRFGTAAALSVVLLMIVGALGTALYAWQSRRGSRG
jgi:raffinose/stachyose/melibiose transport system permease protein